jgi:hypothetical protein
MVEAFVPQARVVCHGPRLSRSRGELVRGGDLSREAKTCCDRRGLVVRGGDLSCEVETCRARVPLVVTGRSATNWSEA